MIFLQDEELILRPLESADSQGNYPVWLNDTDTCQANSHHRMPYSRSDAATFIASVSDLSDALILAIVKKDSQKHVGNISLKDICYYSRSAELAILIGESEGRNSGIGYRASKLIIDHGFMQLNLHSVNCKTFSNNEAMVSLAKKLGMKYVGCLRESSFKNGQYLNVEIFDLLKEDYLASL